MDTILIFAAGDPPPLNLVGELPAAGMVIAADAGYDGAMSLDMRVDVLVGDMDSIVETNLPSDLIVERHPVDKDQTDLDLALELAIREDPVRIVVVGGTGGRADHELATAGLLCSTRWTSVDEIDWISVRGWAHVVRRHRILHADIGSGLSLVPMGGDAEGVTTNGLKWDLNQATLEAGTTLGVSNVMEAPVADINLDSGCLLVIFPSN
jgi:thiamine pyrophosphokinase